jgi:hypothetical protein
MGEADEPKPRGTTVTQPEIRSQNITKVGRRFGILALLAATLATIFGITIDAGAQVDLGTHEIWQQGRLVGYIFRTTLPDSIDAPIDQPYDEHWILFDKYDRHQPTTEIRHSAKSYRSEQDFLDDMRSQWRNGFRYVHVRATESAKLPE